MAGGGSGGDDDPVPINVTPLIDIIFCLIIFFMCSFHFRSIEGRLDAWLPKDAGVRPDPVQPAVIVDDIRIVVSRDAMGVMHRRIGAREVPGDDELAGLIAAQEADSRAVSGALAPVTIDAVGHVPWRDVVRVLDVCAMQKIDRVQFSAPLGAAISTSE